MENMKRVYNGKGGKNIEMKVENYTGKRWRQKE
jgi:hypothetical protein